MRALITGIGGFAGAHLARLLDRDGTTVWGIDRPRGESRPESSRPVIELDMQDRAAVRGALRQAQPDVVFHLAAQASVAAAWQDPEGTVRNNVLSQITLLEALREAASGTRVLVISSNEVYGTPAGPDELPIKESNPLRPSNPYAFSKAAQDLMAYQYFAGYGMPVIRARPFNHIGPGQTDAFVASAFARQVAEVEAGLRAPVIQVGNLEAMRDFTDVRDVVRAYALLAERGVPGDVYNIGSGRPVAIQSLLDFFLERCRTPIKVERDPARYRPVDVPRVWADPAKLKEATGWEPLFSLEETLTGVLEYWRARVAPGPTSSQTTALRDPSLRSQ